MESRAEIQGRGQSGLPLRVLQAELDGQCHVGATELCQDTAVIEFDHGMDDRLRMDDHLDLFGSGLKKPCRLNDLEPFVHQSR